MYKFVIRKNKHRQFVVRFMYRNEVMFTSPPYTAKDEAEQAIGAMREHGPTAPVGDKT